MYRSHNPDQQWVELQRNRERYPLEIPEKLFDLEENEWLQLIRDKDERQLVKTYIDHIHVNHKFSYLLGSFLRSSYINSLSFIKAVSLFSTYSAALPSLVGGDLLSVLDRAVEREFTGKNEEERKNYIAGILLNGDKKLYRLEWLNIDRSHLPEFSDNAQKHLHQRFGKDAWNAWYHSAG